MSSPAISVLFKSLAEIRRRPWRNLYPEPGRLARLQGGGEGADGCGELPWLQRIVPGDGRSRTSIVPADPGNA